MGTLLTWCEECDDDMHEKGGDYCDGCNRELCTECLEEHGCENKSEQTEEER